METKKKTLAIVTGTRAEYGLLRPVIQCLTRRDNLNVALLVTGAHLVPEYGSTVKEIEADGVPIDPHSHPHRRDRPAGHRPRGMPRAGGLCGLV